MAWNDKEIKRILDKTPEDKAVEIVESPTTYVSDHIYLTEYLASRTEKGEMKDHLTWLIDYINNYTETWLAEQLAHFGVE